MAAAGATVARAIAFGSAGARVVQVATARDRAAPVLSADQRAAADTLAGNVASGGFAPTLLDGVKRFWDRVTS